MKKIIYSIVCAFIINGVLALIFPTWFLTRDACRTYLSDTARVDIALTGNVKDSRVTAEGADTRTSQPAWFSDKTYQGTVVEVPISYRSKSYKIKIVPHAAECGENASLVITFRGADIRENGKRRPAWVTFRNIALNGQPIAAEKVVWHDRPFLIKHPHAQEITLSFDVQKPFSAKDLSWSRFVSVFLTLLLLSFFLTPPKKITDRILPVTNGKDIVKVIFDGYRNIDPVYRRSFWIIFGVLCFAFGLHAVWFMWGNHDWPHLEFKQRWLSHQFEGRYMLYSVKMLFSDGVYLPIIYDLTVFIVLALNAVLLCKYWRLESRVTYFVLCGLVLTAQPFTLGMLYFWLIIPEGFIGVTCVLVALLLSEKIVTGGGGYTTRWFVYSLLSMVLINFSLATYPVLISTIAVAFVGKLLILSFAWDGAVRSLKSYLKLFIISMANIAAGVVSYKLMITFVFPPRILYNTETLPPEQIPERLSVLFKECFHQLYEYNSPFIIQWILWIFLGFTILLAIYVCITGNFKQKIVRLVLLFGSLFATKTPSIIAKTYIIADRVELFGLVFFEVLVMVLVITQLRRLRNISVITGTCIVFASIINDLDCLRVWKLGFDAEKMLWNRVLARLEIQKDFDPSRKYDVVQVGYLISIRPRFYTEQREKIIGKDAKPLLYFPYDTPWASFSAHAFYYPTRFRRKSFTEYYGDKRGFYARLKRLYQAGILQKAEVWPKPNGLIVWKDIILFVTDGKELEKYKKQFEREFGKR